jgi:type IV pilus assembly protein PilW
MPKALKRTNKFKAQQLFTLFNREKMRNSNMKAISNNPKGFTLVEMLVAMAAGLIVMAAINSAYVNYQRSHVTEQLVVDMQQNVRAAMSLMKREIRMAGYDPVARDGIDNDGDAAIDESDESAGAGFWEAAPDMIQFEADINYDGDDDDTNENVTYRLVNGTELERRSKDTAGVYQNAILAYDIEALGFAYAFDDDNDGALDQSAGGNIIWAVDSNLGDDKLDTFLDTNDDGVIDASDTEGGANLAGQVDIDRTRAVRIWLLARTRQPIKGNTDNQTYAVGSNHRGPADSDWDPRRKRVLLTTTVYCRNMGI